MDSFGAKRRSHIPFFPGEGNAVASKTAAYVVTGIHGHVGMIAKEKRCTRHGFSFPFEEKTRYLCSTPKSLRRMTHLSEHPYHENETVRQVT